MCVFVRVHVGMQVYSCVSCVCVCVCVCVCEGGGASLHCVCLFVFPIQSLLAFELSVLNLIMQTVLCMFVCLCHLSTLLPFSIIPSLVPSKG